MAAPVDGALPALNGAVLSLRWGIPFAGLLLSIAVLPIVAPRFWHAHYGKIAATWVLVLLIPLISVFGFGSAVHEVAHVLFAEYLPFIIILFALFTISGGICLRGQFRATPVRNTGLLALGATLASIMGTTGASMLLIRPLLTANEGRKSRGHAVVFFILLVGNIGGALSPLGDPPLFIGFLKGVNFFWTTRALLWPTLLVTLALLAIFYLLDRRLFAREPEWLAHKHEFHAAIEGSFNFVLLAGVVGAVLVSGLRKSGITVDVLGTPLTLENVVREVLLVVLAFASLVLTPKAIRAHNVFHWAPIVEVAKLFAGIFVTIIPVIAILGAGRSGALRDLIAALVNPDGTFRNVAVFWVTGILSAFLDNAPTYLVLFNLAAGNAAALMGPLATTLKAISMAAVYFGALTYIGNAPNFMIKAIAEDRGVAMPSFFAYIGYSAVLLVPLLALVALFAL
ncbi:MAG: sodium:proton antiporter [Betaproteobacteria bacterium]|nr:MAG: sodium:proton antiporter [Betaproteobacteria bacterium]